MTLEEFHLDLLDQIKINNNSYNLPSEQSLFNIYIDFLQGSGQFVDDVIDIEYGINGFNFSAFSRDIERKSLNLFLTDLKTGKEPEKIYKKDIESYLDDIVALLTQIILPAKNDLDDSNPLKEFTEDLSNENKHYKEFTVWYFTNGVYSSLSFVDKVLIIEQIKVNLKIVDLKAYQNMVKDKDQQNIEIECSLPAIKVIETPFYTSYLTTVSGYELIRYYDSYGKRLLESNVRTFLSLRGNVNKGIYNTLRSNEKVFFFAYNNGLSGTASELEFTDGNIKSIKNLQIVNGGQTMSTLYKAKQDGVDMDLVQVQMKLSVIHDKENYTKYVSKISEYANTQNKVEKSDFFSNSYFHKRFKELSKLLRVPAKGNSLVTSKWFYERVKGEYLNDQMYMRDSERKKFLLEYPKDQVIDKILISKGILSWDLMPEEVSKGAQLCFAKFAERVSDLYEEGDTDCNEFLFQKTVSQVILYRDIQKLVSTSEWYKGGYRAQTVTYTISLLSLILREKKLTLNWDKIWKEQSIESDLIQWIDEIAEKVHLNLLSPPDGDSNVGTYSKKKICWEKIQTLSRGYNKIPDFETVINIHIEKEENRKGKQKESLDNGINSQIKVIELSRTQSPKKLIEFFNSNYAPGISDTDRGVLKSWYEGKINYPSEKQAKIIIKLLNTAINAGYEII